MSEERDGKVLCKACYQRCLIKDGEYGKCGVRVNREGKLFLTVYGSVASYNTDPIEKKPLYHFLPGTHTFSVGTVGCNFSCLFCQNWEISQYPQTHRYKTFGKNMSPEDIVGLAKVYKTPSISYTYNEPVIFFEFAFDTMKLVHAEGIRNVFVTSGYETEEVIDASLPYLSAMNIDLKSFSDKFYREVCGARLKPVLKTIEYAYKKGVWIEITTLVIPGLNDTPEEIRDIARFIRSISENIPWHISRFFPAYKMTNLSPTPLSSLIGAYEIAKEEGLNYVYLGNYPSEDLESTYCPSCAYKVIERRGFLGEQVKVHLSDGKCPKCGKVIDGIWSLF